MKRRSTTFLAVLTALCGFALAVSIPAASAHKVHNSAGVYCESGTSTVYTEDGSCPTTTTTAAATPTPTTSPSTTPITTPAASTTTASAPTTTTSTTTTASTPTTTTSTTPATPDYADLGQVAANAILTALPGITINADGITITDPSVLPVPISLAPNVFVQANADGFVTIVDNGVQFSVLDDEQLTVAEDGVAVITSDHPAADGLRVGRGMTTGLEQYVILPKGGSANQIYYVLPTGVTFGRHSTWKQVSDAIKVYQVLNTRSLRTARRPERATIQLQKAAANKGRWAFTIKAHVYLKSFAILFDTSKLKDTQAAKVSKQTTRFAIHSKLPGNRSAKDHSTFHYTY